MKKYLYAFVTGALVLMVISVVAAVTESYPLFMRLTGWTGFPALLLAIIFSGAMGSGNTQRLDFYMDSREERDAKFSRAGVLVLFALPLLLAFVAVYLLRAISA